MPHDDADSGDEESDSDHDGADLAQFEDFKISEDERQAAIDRVSFDRCEQVRESGKRYRDDVSIPEIAVELEIPMMTVQEAVETYYLVFAEPPMDGVSVREFRNGRRYFVHGDDVAELDAETRAEAEEQVRAFVGRTLLDNDLDTVDIEESVGEIESLWSDELADFQWPSAGLSLHPDIMEQARKNIQGAGDLMRRGIMRNFQDVSEELTKTTIPELGRAIQSSYSTLAAGSALTASAAVSSVAAVPAGTAIDPSAVQAASQLPVQEAVQSLQAIPMAELVEQLDRQSRLVEQVTSQLKDLHLGTAGLGSMGAVAGRPGTIRNSMLSGFGEGFQPPEPARSPADSETVSAPEPTFSVAEQGRMLEDGVRWRGDHVPIFTVRTIEGLMIVLPPILVEAVAFELQQLYPNQSVTLMYAKLAVIAAIELWLFHQFDDN